MPLTTEGEPLQVIHLKDGKSLKAEILPFGAIIKSIKFRNQEVTLCADDAQYYLENPYFLGATIGRYANRIENGQFCLAGIYHQLNINDNPHSLHGGAKGFDKVLWEVKAQTESEVELYCCSEDGEQGYPGKLQVWQTISAQNGELTISYKAICDKETLVNITNHCYFNLDGSDTIQNHLLQINASHYLPINEAFIPTGEIKPVANSCFDFTDSTNVGSALASKDPQLLIANGLDHCYVYKNDNSLQIMAKLTSTVTNISLTLLSTQPGMQLYTGNFVGAPFKAYQALCLEAQNWPNSPNNIDFPKANLLPNETYNQTIIYAFS